MRAFQYWNSLLARLVSEKDAYSAIHSYVGGARGELFPIQQTLVRAHENTSDITRAKTVNAYTY